MGLLNLALHQKMQNEWLEYRDWLLTLPAEEILDNAYEYAIKTDIVYALEDYELEDEEYEALMRMGNVLDGVKRTLDKSETGYMDDIRAAVENCARDAIQAKKEKEAKKKYPVGTRIRLIHMENDPRPVSEGTIGHVMFVDGIGQVHVRWENGRCLAVIPGIDSFEIENNL